MQKSAVFLLPLVATVPALVCAVPAYAQASFSGSYSGKVEDETLSLTLTQQGDSVTGRLYDGETEMELRGDVVDGGKRITGKFFLQGKEVPITCEIRRQGDQIRFTMIIQDEKTDIMMARKGGPTTGGEVPDEEPKIPATPAKPSTPAKPATKPAKTGGRGTVPATPTVPAATGNAFRHPSGLSFRLPEGWKTVDAGAFLALLPPGQSKPDGDELYLLIISRTGEEANGSYLLSVLEGLLKGGADGKGGVTNGRVAFEETSRSTNSASYEGTTPTGARAYARVIASPTAQFGVGIVALGLKSKIQPREKSLMGLAASAKVGASERDERFIGTWSGGVSNSGLDARDSVGRSQASSTTDSSTTFTFSPDGTYTEVTTSRTIAIGQGVSLDSGPTEEKTQLMWFAGNGRVAFFTPTGIAATGTYRFQGNALVVNVGGKTYVVRK